MGLGPSHQAFLIARVIPKTGETRARYKCIAALHHQWCYGSLPLWAAYGFINLAKERGNAALLREELRKFPESVKENRDTPCPYASFLLEIAFSTGREEDYRSNSVRLSATMRSSGGDNKEGITIMDVTDPERVAICFVSTHGLDVEQYWHVPKMTPLTPLQYLQAYYPHLSPNYPKAGAKEPKPLSEEQMKRLRLTLARLEDVPVVAQTSLSEAWPSEYVDVHRLLRKMGLSESAAPPAELGESSSDSAGSTAVPSLVSLSLSGALEQAIAADDFDALEETMCLPHTLPATLSRLGLLPSFSDNAVAFLAKALQGQPKEVVLSRYHGLTGAQVLQVLEGHSAALEILDISGNTLFSVDDLVKLVTVTPNLRWLNIINTSVSIDDLRTLLTQRPEIFHSLERIVHPFFTSTSQEPFPSAMTFHIHIKVFPWLPCGPLTAPILSPRAIAARMLDFVGGSIGAPRLFWLSTCLDKSVLRAGLAGAYPLEEQKPPVYPVHFIPRHGLSPTFRAGGYAFVIRNIEASNSERVKGNAGCWQYGIYCRRVVGEKVVEDVVDVRGFFERLQQGSDKPALDEKELQPLFDYVTSEHYLPTLLDLNTCKVLLGIRN